jgi:hypothetical protein
MGRVRPVMVSRRLPRYMSLSRKVMMAALRAACTAARTSTSRATGVVAISMT